MRTNELTLSSILLLVYNAVLLPSTGLYLPSWLVPMSVDNTSCKVPLTDLERSFSRTNTSTDVPGGTAVLFSTELNTRSYEGIPLRGYYRYGPDTLSNCTKFSTLLILVKIFTLFSIHYLRFTFRYLRSPAGTLRYHETEIINIF